MNEILNALGNEPNLDALADNVSYKYNTTNSSSSEAIARDTYSNTQIPLTLTNRYTPIKEEKTDLNNLFIR